MADECRSLAAGYHAPALCGQHADGIEQLTKRAAPELSQFETVPASTPPPVSKNHLAQERTPGSAVKFSHQLFYQGSGFFMFLVDVGQLFRCAGHHFMCVTMGPPIRGDPVSHSQAHSFVNVVNCGKGEGTHVLAQRAGKFFFSAVRGCPRLCARTNPWFRGQI